jgi:divalent metal cation (Fe/Co/Zn/Cd) transporter
VLTGNPIWDAVGSIVIGVLLIVVAVLVGVETKALLVGQSAEPQVVVAIRSHLSAQPEVAQVYNLLTQQLGADLMVAVKARMTPQPSDLALVEAINRVEQTVREKFPSVRWMFFEPDVRD